MYSFFSKRVFNASNLSILKCRLFEMQLLHHQIIYAKFKPKVYYPPPSEREVWHYQNADFNAIKNVITDFSWEKAFENLSVDEKVSLFNKTIKNILSNYVPHETTTIDDRDPPWFNKNVVKPLIDEKNKTWGFYIQSNKNDSFFRASKSVHLPCT